MVPLSHSGQPGNQLVGYLAGQVSVTLSPVLVVGVIVGVVDVRVVVVGVVVVNVVVVNVYILPASKSID